MLEMNDVDINNLDEKDNTEWIYSDDDEEEKLEEFSEDEKVDDQPYNDKILLSNNCTFYQYKEQSEKQPVRVDTRHKVSDDEQMKIFATETLGKLCALGGMQCSSKECKYGGKCCKKATISAVLSVRTKIWGEDSAPAPSAKERKERIEEILNLQKMMRSREFAKVRF